MVNNAGIARVKLLHRMTLDTLLEEFGVADQLSEADILTAVAGDAGVGAPKAIAATPGSLAPVVLAAHDCSWVDGRGLRR